MDKKDIGVCISCFENTSLLNYYTESAREVISKFAERGFIVYVHTNNPDEFYDLNCRVVPSKLKIISINEVAKLPMDEKDLIDFNEYWTFYKKIQDIDYVLNKHDYCLYVDSDNLPVDDTFNQIEEHLLGSEWDGGIYFSGTWADLNPDKNPTDVINGYSYPTAGYLKNFDYFYYIDETDGIDPSLDLEPFDESCILIRKFEEWNSFRNLVLGKYQTAAVNNDKKEFPWLDDEPYRLFGRAEGFGWVMAIEELGIFNRAKVSKILYNIRKSLVVKNHPTVYYKTGK